jgi:hypothetical protein
LSTIHVRGLSSASIGPRGWPAGVTDEDRIGEPEDADDDIELTPEDVRDGVYRGLERTYN